MLDADSAGRDCSPQVRGKMIGLLAARRPAWVLCDACYAPCTNCACKSFPPLQVPIRDGESRSSLLLVGRPQP